MAFRRSRVRSASAPPVKSRGFWGFRSLNRWVDSQSDSHRPELNRFGFPEMRRSMHGPKLHFGFVRVIAGSHAGTIGYYDDDDDNPANAIVYLNEPLIGDYRAIPKRYLRNTVRFYVDGAAVQAATSQPRQPVRTRDIERPSILAPQDCRHFICRFMHCCGHDVTVSVQCYANTAVS